MLVYVALCLSIVFALVAWCSHSFQAMDPTLNELRREDELKKLGEVGEEVRAGIGEAYGVVGDVGQQDGDTEDVGDLADVGDEQANETEEDYEEEIDDDEQVAFRDAGDCGEVEGVEGGEKGEGALWYSENVEEEEVAEIDEEEEEEDWEGPDCVNAPCGPNCSWYEFQEVDNEEPKAKRARTS